MCIRDRYSVLGDIIELTEEKNIIKNEQIYCIKVSCNDIIFSVCINKNDLIGEPVSYTHLDVYKRQ